jgi:RHS repeat-associated protein
VTDAAGRRVARRDSGGNVFYSFGGLRASDCVVTNSTGTVCYDSDFYPFGDSRVYTNNCPQNTKYAGMEQDSETDFYHTQFRQYYSSWGRWMSPDPLGGDVTNPQSLNRYAYAGNDPTNFVDPLGLFEEATCTMGDFGECLGGGGGGGGGEVYPGDCAEVEIDGVGMGSTCDGGPGGVPGGDPRPGGGGGGGGGTGPNPNVTKTFEKTFSCDKNAAAVISVVTRDFSKFADYSGTFDVLGGPWAHSDVWFEMGPVKQGGHISITNVNTVNRPGYIDPGGSAYRINTGVDVALVTPTTFTFDTVPGHVLYPASITFAAQDMGPGQVRFSVQVNGDFASPFSRLAFNLGGGSNLEDNIWNNLLNNVAQSCGQ